MYPKQKNNVAKKNHRSNKGAMEALQTRRIYLGNGGCYNRDIPTSLFGINIVELTED